MIDVHAINKPDIAVASVANWVISVAWYATFGTTWAQLTDTPPEWTWPRPDPTL